jgi:phage/plasmid-associated DNA primase
MLNAWFFIAKVPGSYPIAQIEGDTIKYISSQDFRTKLANLFVQFADGKRGKAANFWLAHEKREERQVIFDPTQPSGAAVEGKYNLWRGHAIRTRRVSGKHRTLLRHIREVICRDDRGSFKYLLFWLAWAVQNPHRNPETAVVLKSAQQGTGKSTLSYAMKRIFGEHARTIADKQRLFEKFNADLETAAFIDADEMLWAGDRGGGDSLKSLITSQTLTLEVKHGSRWEVPNRLHMIMTTNHEHAIQSGVQDRRFFVLEVSRDKAQDEGWFGRLYADLDNGGLEEFLWLLQRVNLTGWHPRRLPKTSAAIEQQRFSADSVSQWAQACIDADGIVGGLSILPLPNLLPTHVLYDAYKNHCRNYPVSSTVFGKALTEMFGPSTRESASTGSATSRPRTYRVPNADAWQIALDQRLGIKGPK